LPEDFVPHRKITALMKKRHDAVSTGKKLNWGTAEALAFASLVHQGTCVRLSGQDSQRGTFNHRHAVLTDSTTGKNHTPLADIAAAAGGSFTVYNSMLSEAAVLGFEYGYSVETPHDLTIWEAQFGDFANGAQVIIDQFIASSMTMGPFQRSGSVPAAWLRRTGTGTFERAHRTLSATLRRQQYAGGSSEHTGPIIPPAAPTGSRRLSPTADRIHAQSPAQTSGLYLAPGRLHRRPFSGDHPGSAQRGELPTHPALQR
ncbi:MAG: hypothetical protein GXP51_00980, partial [Deltaproteobacteria bacterium]|nr:hypothetical protein [Deltaproteobacteria bacterium]